MVNTLNFYFLCFIQVVLVLGYFLNMFDRDKHVSTFATFSICPAIVAAVLKYLS